MTPTTPEVEISWQDYLAVVLLRKWFFLVPCIVSLSIGVLVMLFSPRIYATSALVLVQNETLINPLIQGLAMPTAISDRLNTLREEVLSWSNLMRLIKSHGLDRSFAQNDPAAYDKLVGQLRKDISIKMKGTSLIQISYEGRNPAKVQEMVNALTDIVIERNTTIQQQETSTAVSFIESQLGVYRKKLEESEGKLREFKELHMTQMPVVTALNNQLRDLELQYSNLLIDNTEEHPWVVEVKRQMEEVRRRRDAEIRRLVARGILAEQDPNYDKLLKELALPSASPEASKDPTLVTARETYASVIEGLEAPEVSPTIGPQVAVNQEGTTIQMNEATATSLALSPRLQQELSSLTRDYSVNEDIYRRLLEKLERAKITGRLDDNEEGGKFVVIERARLPLHPVKPNLLLVFTVSVFAGIAIGVGAVFVAEYLDQSIQTSEEAAELLQVPVLGSVSTIVTEADLEQRWRRRKGWVSLTSYIQRFKTYIVTPIWSRVDQALLRWGL